MILLEPWIRCVFHGNHKAHRANKPLINFGLLFVLLRAGYSQFVSYFTIAADFLQVTIVSVLKIFSFFNREKVLGDISTGIVGLQHAVSECANVQISANFVAIYIFLLLFLLFFNGQVFIIFKFFIISIFLR